MFIFGLSYFPTVASLGPQAAQAWQLGPFRRPVGVNPILRPDLKAKLTQTIDPSRGFWENANVFNPAAAYYQGKIIILYRAEADKSKGVGQHTSRIGYAESTDGIHFKKSSQPVLYPKDDNNFKLEHGGGCEDPRVVKSPFGGFVLTYTAYDTKLARLCVATSPDLKHWKKFGSVFANAFGGKFKDTWSKSGSIVCKPIGNNLVATKIDGKFWMYWGEEPIHFATSTDLIHWTPGLNPNGDLATLFDRRAGKFDSDLVEPGPPAVLTKQGIVFLYNGKNSSTVGDPSISAGAYSAGEALLSPIQPWREIARTDHPFLKPEEPFEMTGQYKSGTVFIEGLVPFRHNWYLYFGTADSFVGVAVASW